MSETHDYADVFGEQENRATRGQILGSICDLPVLPEFRDAWVEKWQNPDRAPGVGPLIIVFYLELGEGPKARKPHALALFALRNSSLYRSERDDTVARGYSTFYFAAPAGLSETNLASLMRAAVEPVDTDARWAAALAVIHEEEEAEDADRHP